MGPAAFPVGWPGQSLRCPGAKSYLPPLAGGLRGVLFEPHPNPPRKRGGSKTKKLGHCKASAPATPGMALGPVVPFIFRLFAAGPSTLIYPRQRRCAMKKWWLTIAVFLALFAGYRPGVATAQSGAGVPDIGNEVRGIFASKCAACHGPNLPKPKGRFGYVLDLRRIAENPEMVIPQRPDESELWVLIQRDEMPPSDSLHGALTPEQKEVVRSWIAAGAPDASPLLMDPSLSVRSEPMHLASIKQDPVDRTVRWLGKFHLLLLHFPIALVLAAGFAEFLSLRQRNSAPSELVRYCTSLGALAAIPTAALGWLHAASGNGASSPQILMAHRWLGTAAAVWLVVTAVYVERDTQRGVRSPNVRLLLLCGVLITALVAHLGGLLTNGEDFFRY